MINRLNAIRRAAGLPALTENARLSAAARAHVVDLASGRVSLDNSHVGSDGSTVGIRARREGYSAAVIHEMTGWGWGTWDNDEQVNYWLNSDTHRPIIHKADVTEIGMAFLVQPGAWSRYEKWWVVVVAKPSGVVVAPPPPSGNVAYVPVVAGGQIVPPSGGIDLLPYLRGDGRMYEVRHPDGQTETFQTQTEGDVFYQVKNSQWEQFRVLGGFIWRGVDTSPGEGRAYIQYETGQKFARWCPRWMTIGQEWHGPGHWVQFRDKATCADSAMNSGPATNVIRLVACYERLRFRDVVVDDVIELRTHTSEGMMFARGWGLVSWRSPWGSSEVVQVFAPGERPALVREKMDCFEEF